MRAEKVDGAAEELRKAALACLEAAGTLRRPVLWEISQEWSLKRLMPPDELLGRVDELKAAAGKAAEEGRRLIGPFVGMLASMHNEPVKVGWVKASSWHEAAVKVAETAAGWHLGAAEIKAYFKSRLDPESGQLRPRLNETAATDMDTELHHLMAAVDHDAEEMEARLRIEGAKLAGAAGDVWTEASDFQRKVLTALRTSGPMKGDTIARATGRKPSGSVRTELRHMEQLRWIRLGPEGYEAIV